MGLFFPLGATPVVGAARRGMGCCWQEGGVFSGFMKQKFYGHFIPLVKRSREGRKGNGMQVLSQ